MYPATNLKETSSPSSIYYVSFEDYLKPKSVKKKNALLLAYPTSQKPNLRLRLLEHPALIASHKSKCFLLKEKVENVLKRLTEKSKIKKLFGRIPSKLSIDNIELPRFLTFLNARNDQTECKRKSGFEIYCELASIHGFNNFVGATTWQRAFWFLVILTAVLISGSIVLLSHFINVSTPTIVYSESTQYPSCFIPFPAVTICNINKISKSKAETLAGNFQQATNTTIPLEQLINSFTLALFTTEHIMARSDDYNNLNRILKLNNYTMAGLLDDIAPNCHNELLKCGHRGKFVKCEYIFQKIQTPYGRCCSFNYKAVKNNSIKDFNEDVTQSINCGYAYGLSVLLDPQLEDYKVASFLTPGFQVFIHDAYDFVDIGTQEEIITPSTTNNIGVWPEQTYATEHIQSLKTDIRKCYLPNERKLYYFDGYTQVNCLAECRSIMFFNKCHCALPYRPKMHNWTFCGLEHIQCYAKYKYLLTFNSKPNEEHILCDCYPLCDFQMYTIITDSKQLTRKYSRTQMQLYGGINLTNHILLRVYTNGLHAKRFRLDVTENWLSFLGTFGGITGLFMGYSFLSGFELIFFVLVRPVCNWLNKRLIRNRIKKRQQKAAREQPQKHKLQQ